MVASPHTLRTREIAVRHKKKKKKQKDRSRKWRAARLGPIPFRIDPDSVEWNFRIKAAVKKTFGGKVVQILGVDISDIVVTGSFGGWKEQRRFLRKMKNVADQQVEGYVNPGTRKRARGARPMRFLFPLRKWDFLVYLKDFSSPTTQEAVVHTNENFAPKWQLTLWVVEDNSGLTTVAKDAIIARLARGMGWKQTKYNGPMGPKQLTDFLGSGMTVTQWLSEQQVGGG